MDIITTIPLKRLEIARQEDEVVRGLPDEKCKWFWLLRPKPKDLRVGDWVYFVEDGLITARCPVMELGYFNFECQVSGKQWTGYQARLGQNRVFLHPIAYPGFQGWRYVSPELHASLDVLETECSCEPLTPPADGLKRCAAIIAKLKVKHIPARGQISALENILRTAAKKKETVFVSSTSRRIAEDLAEYLKERGLTVRYFHREIAPRYRKKIVQEYRKDRCAIVVADTLRELPRSSTVVILDADQGGELRTADWIAYHAAHATRQVIICGDRISPAVRKVFPQLQ